MKTPFESSPQKGKTPLYSKPFNTITEAIDAIDYPEPIKTVKLYQSPGQQLSFFQ